MVEGHAQEASEEEMLGAIEVAKKPIAEICALIVKLRELAGKDKLPLSPLKVELQKTAEIRAYAHERLSKALFTKVKQERYAAVRRRDRGYARPSSQTSLSTTSRRSSSPRSWRTCSTGSCAAVSSTRASA